jgi:exonuclease III
MDQNSSRAVLEYTRKHAPGITAKTAPTSQMTAALLGEYRDNGQEDPAAGIIILMTDELANCLRKPPQCRASGRLMHLEFGNGTSVDEDEFVTHVAVAYGVSGQSAETGARGAMARALSRELENILTDIDKRRTHDGGEKTHRTIVCGDINSTQYDADRTGKRGAVDEATFALWRVLERFQLKDLVLERAAANGTYAPMTYFTGKTKNPNSRIDVCFVSESLLPWARAATAGAPGALSASHAAIACSFNGPGFKFGPQVQTNATIDNAVCILASTGGRRWNFPMKHIEKFTSAFLTVDVLEMTKAAAESKMERTENM